MFEPTKFAAGVAVSFSILTMVAMLTVIPTLYQQISDLESDILSQMDDFKVQTDGLWEDIMTLRKQTPNVGSSSVNSGSLAGTIFGRPKRQAGNCRKKNFLLFFLRFSNFQIN